MRKQTSYIIVSAFLLLLTISVFYTSTKCKCHPKTIIKTKTITKLKRRVTQKALSRWIYEHSFRCSMGQAERYARISLSYEHPLLTTAIIERESSFDPMATTKVNGVLVIGLMQIYTTKQHIDQLKRAHIITTVRDLYDPAVNIRAGIYILNDIIHINGGNIEKSLRMYCGGSHRYVRDVLTTLGQLTLEVSQ